MTKSSKTALALTASFLAVAGVIFIGAATERQKNLRKLADANAGDFICEVGGQISTHYVGVTDIQDSPNGGIIITIDGYKRLRYVQRPGESCPLFILRPVQAANLPPPEEPEAPVNYM